eukprot:scaffold15184_cov56-Phaeocystis_antarctica.AAC.1
MVKAAAAAEAADLAAARLAEIAILLVAAVDVPHRELVLALARQELIRSAGVCRSVQVRAGVRCARRRHGGPRPHGALTVRAPSPHEELDDGHTDAKTTRCQRPVWARSSTVTATTFTERRRRRGNCNPGRRRRRRCRDGRRLRIRRGVAAAAERAVARHAGGGQAGRLEDHLAAMAGAVEGDLRQVPK